MSRGIRIVSTLVSFGIIVGGLATLVLWTRYTDRFPLRGIEIRNELKHVAESDIRKVVFPHLVKGFFWLDVEIVQNGLKRIPWVHSAEVRRVWPDRLAISIQEQTPQARWGDKGILSTEGVIFYPETSTISEKWPQFDGPVLRAKEMLQQYLSLLEVLGPIGLRVKALELSTDGSWKMMLENRIAVILGKSDLDQRLARFVLVYPGSLQVQSKRIAYIDLRYTNGLAIGWKESNDTANGG